MDSGDDAVAAQDDLAFHVLLQVAEQCRPLLEGRLPPKCGWMGKRSVVPFSVRISYDTPNGVRRAIVRGVARVRGDGTIVGVRMRLATTWMR